jgi:hypothetical protein
MSQKQSIYQEARALIDAANSADPNQVTADGKEWPKELLYSERMSNMLERYKPDADNAMKLAIRAQHIERQGLVQDSSQPGGRANAPGGLWKSRGRACQKRGGEEKYQG